MNKFLAALAIVSVPLVIVVSRHFSTAGWPITAFIVSIWAIQMSMMFQFIKYTRLQYECPADYVVSFMTEDDEGTLLVRHALNSESGFDEQRAALHAFGEACFRRGALAERARQNAL